MYNPVSVANYFINKSFYEGLEITPMKVLKLVYIAHGWHLAITDKELITEQAEAWKYGPVVRSVYDVFKHYGNEDITNVELSVELYRKDFENLENNKTVVLLLNKVWDVYKSFSGIELSGLTHQPGTPWFITWNHKGGSKMQGAIIPNALIKEHYLEKLNAKVHA